MNRVKQRINGGDLAMLILERRPCLDITLENLHIAYQEVFVFVLAFPPPPSKFVLAAAAVEALMQPAGLVHPLPQQFSVFFLVDPCLLWFPDSSSAAWTG